MASILKSLRLLADPNRLRLLLLLEREELSVAELQEILSTGQSRISTHLAQLKQAGLVEDRKQGKNSLYRLKDRQIVPIFCMRRRARFRKPRTIEGAATGPRQTPRQSAGLLRRAGREVRPGLCAGAFVEGPGGDAAAVDAAHGDRRSGRGRGDVFAAARAARANA